MYQSLARLTYLKDVRKKAYDIQKNSIKMNEEKAIVMIQAVGYFKKQ